MNLKKYFSIALTMLCGICSASGGYPNNMIDAEDEALSGAMNAGATGLADWLVSEPYLNLWIHKQPLTYKTSFGGSIGFGAAYKQRNSRSTTNVFGLGTYWECSWLSYVTYTTNGTNVSATKLFVKMGGERNYTADGNTKEFKSTTTMTVLRDGSNNVTGFQINKPSGGRDIYSYLLNLASTNNYALLTQEISAIGLTNKFEYDTLSNVVRLRKMIDYDNRTNTIYYDGTFTAQIKAVTNHYNSGATFAYSSGGILTQIVNMGNLTSKFVYDAQGLVTNIITDYGTTKFKTTTNSYEAGYNLGGTNKANRSVQVTGANASTKQLFLYRDRSSDLFSNSYPTNEVPVTSPLTNVDARNSFHWSPKQFEALSNGYLNSGNPDDLTTNDFKLATVKHWLRGYNNEASVSESLSIIRGGSPNGTANGQKTWFDYAGKVSVGGTNWGSRGTNAAPLFSALVLPDGNSRYTYTELNKWEKPTIQKSTYGTATPPATRMYTSTYSSDGLDLITLRGPSNELLSSNAYNSYHQIVTNYNALNYMTRSAYDSGHRLITQYDHNGLETDYTYYSSGDHVGWLHKIEKYDPYPDQFYYTNVFTYTNGNLLTSLDARGNTITNTWDSLLRVSMRSFENGTLTNYFNVLDLVQSVNRVNSTNTVTFDSMRLMTNNVDSRGKTNCFGYCGCGALERITNALGQVYCLDYDNLQNQIAFTVPDLSTVEYEYNSLNQLTKVSDPGGNCTTNYYDNNGLAICSSNAFGRVFLKEYDEFDRPTNILDANGVIIKLTYDALGRVLTQTYPDGGVEKLEYSFSGLISYTNQLGSVTRYAYNLLGRKIAETNANNEVIQYEYNYAGDLTRLIDGKNQSTQWQYDQYGQLTNVINANNVSILRYKYDQEGRMTNRWSKAKGDTYYSYDQNGNLTNINYPVSADVSFTYDDLNRVTQMVDGIGTTVYTYDSNGNLLSEDGPWDQDTVSYSYTSSGLRSQLTLLQPNAPAWVQTYAHDSANRLTNTTSPAGAFVYSYTTVSNINSPGSLVLRIAYPNGAYVTNTYDTTGRMLSTKLNNSSHGTLNSHSYTYNVANQRTRQTRTAGDYVDYTYDYSGQLRSAQGKEAGGTSRLNEQFGYAYDAAWNLSRRTNNALIQTFAVDTLNQLTTITRSGTLTVAGSTTSAATNVTVNSQVASLYADNTFAKPGFTLTNGNNSFTAVGQDSSGRADTNTVTANLPATVTLQYDDNGNLISDGQRSIEYDDENQVVAITNTNVWKVYYLYDGHNRRKITRHLTYSNGAYFIDQERHYLHDGACVVQERTTTGIPSVAYTRGIALQVPQANLLHQHAIDSEVSVFYHSDGVGHITTIINSDQNIIASYKYSPSGEITDISGSFAQKNTYAAFSKEYDWESGLSYFGARYLDAKLQRWLTADPAASSSNLYFYANNDAINNTDAFGLFNLAIFPPSETSFETLRANSGWGLTYKHEVPAWDIDHDGKECFFIGDRWLAVIGVLYPATGHFSYSDANPLGRVTINEKSQQVVLGHEDLHVKINKYFFRFLELWDEEFMKQRVQNSDAEQCKKELIAKVIPIEKHGAERWGQLTLIREYNHDIWEDLDAPHIERVDTAQGQTVSNAPHQPGIYIYYKYEENRPKNPAIFSPRYNAVPPIMLWPMITWGDPSVFLPPNLPKRKKSKPPQLHQ
jgi:RHS repeat-associated protein